MLSILAATARVGWIQAVQFSVATATCVVMEVGGNASDNRGGEGGKTERKVIFYFMAYLLFLSSAFFIYFFPQFLLLFYLAPPTFFSFILPPASPLQFSLYDASFIFWRLLFILCIILSHLVFLPPTLFARNFLWYNFLFISSSSYPPTSFYVHPFPSCTSTPPLLNNGRVAVGVQRHLDCFNGCLDGHLLFLLE